MYICMCNPFTDQDLEGALENQDVEKKTSAVYKACTGGEQPCCGTCICEIRDRIQAHNQKSELISAE